MSRYIFEILGSVVVGVVLAGFVVWFTSKVKR